MRLGRRPGTRPDRRHRRVRPTHLERPTCAEAPLVVASVDLEGHAETRDLGVPTSGDVGFSARPLGAEGIAFVVLDPTTIAAHAVTVAAPGEDPIDHGPVNARRVCDSPDGPILIPSELSPEANQVLRITRGGVEPVESNGSLDEALARETEGVSLATFTECSDGQALLHAMTAKGVETFTLDLTSPDDLIPLEIPSEFAAGAVSIGAQGQFFSWAAGEETTWQLAEERSGSWAAVSEVDSVEPPQLTVAGDTTHAALLTRDGSLMIEIIS